MLNTNARDLLFGGDLPSGFPPPPPVAAPSHAALAISGDAGAPLPSREERWAMKQRQRMQQMQQSQGQQAQSGGGGVVVISNQASIPAAPGSLPSALIGGGAGLTLADRLKANATTDPSFASGFSPRAPQSTREPEYLQPRVSQPVVPLNLAAQPVPSVTWNAEEAYVQQYLPPPKQPQQQQQQQQQNFIGQFDQNSAQWQQPPSQQQQRGGGGGGSSYFESASSTPQITVGKAVQLLDVENGNHHQQQPRGVSALSLPPSSNNINGGAAAKSILPGANGSPSKQSQQSKQSYGDELMKQQEAKERQKEEQKRREKEEASSARGILPSNSHSQNQNNYFYSPQRKQQEQQQQQQQQQQLQFDIPVQSKAQMLRAAAMSADPMQEQVLGLPSMASIGGQAIAAKKSAYGDELQRQARLREEAKNKEKELERNEAKKSLGLAAIVAASENHGRGMAPAEKRTEMQQFAGQRVSQYQQQQQQQQQQQYQRLNVPHGYTEGDQIMNGSSPANGDFSRMISSRSPLQAEADARLEARFEPPNGPLGGLSSKQQLQPGHDKELYKHELQRQMQEKETQKMRSKLEALNPLHVPDGREGERQKHRAIVIQAQQQHQQAFLAARVLDEAESRLASQQQQSYPQQLVPQPFIPPPSLNLPQSFPGGPPVQSMMPPEPSPTNNNQRRNHRPVERFSPVSFNLSSAPQEDIAARKRLEYAADLERQVLDAKMRKEAEKRSTEERERRLEMEAVEYAREQALRKARGGNGEPLRDVDGRVLTDVKSVAAANKSLMGASGGRQMLQGQMLQEQSQMYGGVSGPSSFSARDDLFGGNGGGEGGFQSFHPPPPSSSSSSQFTVAQSHHQSQSIYGQQAAGPPPFQAYSAQAQAAPFLDRQHTISSSITRPVSPTELARKSRLQMENALALEQQIEEIRRKKADETARRKIEEAVEEERLSKERQELGEKFKREEKDRQQREQEDLDKALQAQIEAKNKERADERERERILEERAEAKLRQQNKELAEKYKESHPLQESGGAGEGNGSDKKALSSANTSPVVQDEVNNKRGGIAPVGAAARRLELFGPASSTSPTTNEPPSIFPPTGSRFIDSSPAQVTPQYPPQSFQQPPPPPPPQRWAPPPFFPAPPPAPVDPMLDPRVQQRISAAEEELERLRNALSELHVQTNDNRFADGLQRLGLSVPGSQQERDLQHKAALQRQIELQRATAQPLTLFPPSAPLPLRTVSFAGLAKAAPSTNNPTNEQSPPNTLDISLGGSSRLLASSSGLDASLWEPMKDAHVSPKAVLNKLESLEPHQHEERGKHMHDLLRSLFPDLNVIGADQLTSPQSVAKPPSLAQDNDEQNERPTNVTSYDVDESRESSRPLGQSFKTLQQNRDFTTTTTTTSTTTNNNSSSSSSGGVNGDSHNDKNVEVKSQLQSNTDIGSDQPQVNIESGSGSQATADGAIRSQVNTESRSQSQTSRNEADTIVDSPVQFQPPEHGSEHNSAEKRKSLVGSFLSHFGEPEHSPNSSFQDKNSDQQPGDESFAPPDMLRISKHFKGRDGKLFHEEEDEEESGLMSQSPRPRDGSKMMKSHITSSQGHVKSLYSSPAADDDVVSAIVSENKRKLEILEKKGSLHFSIEPGAPPLSSHASARSSVVTHLRPFAAPIDVAAVAATGKGKRSEIDGHSKHIPLLEHEGDDYHTPDNLHPSSRYKDVISASQRMAQSRSLQSSAGEVEYDDDVGLVVDSGKPGRSRNSRFQGGRERGRARASDDQYRSEDYNRDAENYRPRNEEEDPAWREDGYRREAEDDRRVYNSRGDAYGARAEPRDRDYNGRGRGYDYNDNRERGGARGGGGGGGGGYIDSRGSERRAPIPVNDRDYRVIDSQYYDDSSRYYSYRKEENDEFFPTERVERIKMRRDPRRAMQYEDDQIDRRRRYPPPPQQYRDYR